MAVWFLLYYNLVLIVLLPLLLVALLTAQWEKKRPRALWAVCTLLAALLLLFAGVEAIQAVRHGTLDAAKIGRLLLALAMAVGLWAKSGSTREGG